MGGHGEVYPNEYVILIRSEVSKYNAKSPEIHYPANDTAGGKGRIVAKGIVCGTLIGCAFAKEISHLFPPNGVLLQEFQRWAPVD